VEQEVTQESATAWTVDGDLVIADVHLDRTEDAVAHAVSRGANDRERSIWMSIANAWRS